MTRLKGADLGVALPSTALNYRGAWSASASPAYAVGDLVVRNNVPYVAVIAPGSADPATPFVAAVNAQATYATSNDGFYQAACRAIAQQFTPSAAMVVDTVSLRQQNATDWSGTVKVGIVAGAVTTGDVSGLTFLASGSAPASAFAVNGWGSVALDSPVALQSGTQYTLVVLETTGAGNIGGVEADIFSHLSATNVAVGGTIYRAASGGGTTLSASNNPFFFPFQLSQNGPSWKPLTIANPLNNRGAWTSSPTPAYAVNDFVVRNGVPYVANLVPGSADPVAGTGSNVGGQTRGDSYYSTASYGNATAFTVSAPVLATKLTAYLTSANLAGAGTVRIGIATGVATSTVYNAVNWLGYADVDSSSLVSAAAPGAANSVTIPGVLLQPGTTYHFVIVAVTGNFNVGSFAIANPGNVTNGGVVTGAGLFYGGTPVGTGQFTSSSPTAGLKFDITTQYWSALAPLAPVSHGTKVWKSGTQSISPNTWTAVSWDNEAWDTDAYHDMVTNPTRITIPPGLGGKVLFQGQILFSTTGEVAGVDVGLRVLKNGTTEICRFEQPIPNTATINTTLPTQGSDMAVPGDYYELQAFHANTGAINLGTGAAFTWFDALLLGS